MIEVGLQILMEAFTALLGRPGPDRLRDAHPIVCTVQLHELKECRVLGLRPRASFVLRHVDE